MEMQGLKLIHLILQRTKEGILLWHKTDHDIWESRIADKDFQVEFVFFMRTDETGSDRTMARLLAFNLVFDYCIGTEGFDLLCEMLSVGDRDWQEWKDSCQQRFDEGLRFLEALDPAKAKS